jgi:metallophosphoesterase superfamily enzyme
MRFQVVHIQHGNSRQLIAEVQQTGLRNVSGNHEQEAEHNSKEQDSIELTSEREINRLIPLIKR